MTDLIIISRMRNIFVYVLLTVGFCSLGAYSQASYWDLPTNFKIINSCLNSDSDNIFILGGYVDSDDEFIEIDIIKWTTSENSYSILNTTILEDLQNASFNGTVLPTNNITYLYCPLNNLYLVQGYGDPLNYQNKMFQFPLSASLLSKFAFSNLFLLMFFAFLIIV